MRTGTDHRQQKPATRAEPDAWVLAQVPAPGLRNVREWHNVQDLRAQRLAVAQCQHRML